MVFKYQNLDINYQTLGSGKDLILLHGWRQDVSTWWTLAESLKTDFKIWMIDMPGFGRSDIPGKAWQVVDYADMVADFIGQNKIKKPILLGHSLGGNISLKLAAKYPSLIDKLILEDSSGLRKKSTLNSQLFLLLAKIFKYSFPPIPLKEKIRNRFYGSIGSDYLSAGPLKETFQNIVNEDLSEEIKKIPSETLIIWGENDKEVSLSSAKQIYHLIKNSQLEVMEGVKHFPHLENPKLFVHYIKDFGL